MRAVLIELCDLLGAQKTVIENMLALSREEKRIILSGEAELLEDIVRSEFKELSKLNALEKKRLALNDRLAEVFSLPVDELNISSIVNHVEPDERNTLLSLQSELIALLSDHKALNMENRELIEAHLEYSDAVLDLMVASEDPLNNFYGNDGKATPERKKATGIIDSRA